MPLKQGSSDATVQENIKRILNKEAGYDPPYLDPGREKYTPEQAAAIAYAKAGRRNNTGGNPGNRKKPYKEPNNTKLENDKPKWWKEKNVKVQGVKPKDSTTPGDSKNTKKDPQLEEVKNLYSQLDNDPTFPDKLEKSWDKIPDPVKKNLIDYAKTKLAEKAPAPAPAPAPADEQMKKEVEEGYKYKWGDTGSTSFITDEWDNLTDKQKKAYHQKAQSFLKEKEAKEANKKPVSTQSPAGTGPYFQNNDLVINGKTFKPGKKLPGSTQPTLYVDENGNGAYVVKEGGAQGQNIAESTSNKVYNALAKELGSGAVQSTLVGDKLVNKFIQGGRTLDDLSPKEFATAKDTIKKSHMADALLANWDYAGLDNDNIMVGPNGELTRIDTGGTFNYRAQGAAKDYGSAPMEIWSLRNGTQGKQFWADATDKDYRQLWVEQADSILNSSNSIKNLVNQSTLSQDVKDSFEDRVYAISLASDLIIKKNPTLNNSVLNLADKGTISWKEVDGAIEKAFKAASMSKVKGKTWRDDLKYDINKNLEDLVKSKQGPNIPSGWGVKQSQQPAQRPPAMTGNAPIPPEEKEAYDKVVKGYATQGLNEKFVNSLWSSYSPENKQAMVDKAEKLLEEADFKKLNQNLSLLKKTYPEITDWGQYWKTLDDDEKDDLIDGLKQGGVEIDFSLAQDQNKFNEQKFKDTVDIINEQLIKTVSDEYGDPEPLKNLSDGGKYCLREYSGSLYRPLNEYLRGTKTNPNNDKFLGDIVKSMDQALSSLPDGPKDTYWRMAKISLKPDRQHLIDEIKNLKPGDIYSDKGYSSFTSEQTGEVLDTFYHSSKFCFMFKYEGSKLKKIAPLSSYVEEEESLSQRNQKFKVKSVGMEDTSNLPKYISWGGNEKATGKILLITLEDA